MKKIAWLLLFGVQSIFAAGGYEKPSLWSAKASSIGGAYSSSVVGSESIFYNPAGLGDQQDVNLQTVLIGGYVSGPVTQSNENLKGDDSILPTGGIFANKEINKEFSVGLGIYGIAGLDSGYNNVSYGSIDSDFANYKKDYYSRLSVMEYAVGGSYRISKNLSIGAAIRAQSVKASFSQTSVSVANGMSAYGVADGTPISISTVELKNLQQNKAGSFKLGAKWLSDDQSVGVGLAYRSKVDFNVKGTVSGDQVYTATGSSVINAVTSGSVVPVAGEVNSLTGGVASVSNTLPAQVNIDSHYKLSTLDKVYLGYNFTQYSKSKVLAINGSVVDITGTTTKIPDTELHWKDMHDFKVGYSHDVSESLQLRTGFAYTTAVTPENYSGPTYCPPGPTKQISMGFGKVFWLTSSNAISLDMAAEYYWSSAKGTAQGSIDTANSMQVNDIYGTYSVKAWSLFTGVSYSF